MRDAGAVDVVAQGLRPMDFGGLPGFRFELRLRSPQGLEMAGIAAGVVHEDSLYLILFTGARAWYFPRLEPAVEAILASIRREA